MITVISGTNRRNSLCLKFAKQYVEYLRKHTKEEVRLLALEEVAHDWLHPDMYKEDFQTPSLKYLQDEFILSAEKFAIFSPEYNGGIPGVLKLFLDACSVRKYRDNFKGKKAALIGVATGRAGNLRGMDQLASIVNHMGGIIMPFMLPISQIKSLMNGDDRIHDTETLKVMEKHAKEFVNF